MSIYEVFAIIHPSLSEQEVVSLVEDLEKRLEERTPDTTVINRRIERDQSLSYPIARQLRGHTIHLDVRVGDGAELSDETQREMHHHEHVLRFLVFKKQETGPEPAVVGATVIDRMRSRRSSAPRPTEHHRPAPVPTAPEESGSMDEKEVDKKIEELLN